MTYCRRDDLVARLPRSTTLRTWCETKKNKMCYKVGCVVVRERSVVDGWEWTRMKAKMLCKRWKLLWKLKRWKRVRLQCSVWKAVRTWGDLKKKLYFLTGLLIKFILPLHWKLIVAQARACKKISTCRYQDALEAFYVDFSAYSVQLNIL